MRYNLWVVLKDTARSAINTRLQWDDSQGEYTGPVGDKAARIFERMVDRAGVQGMFKVPNIGGSDYYLYSLYSSDGFQKIQDAIAYLTTSYPAQFFVPHTPWDEDGLPVGFTWNDPVSEDDPPHSNGITGTPLYDTHAKLMELMPDVDDGLGGFTTALLPHNVNLRLGQKPRIFIKTDGSVWT